MNKKTKTKLLTQMASMTEEERTTVAEGMGIGGRIPSQPQVERAFAVLEKYGVLEKTGEERDGEPAFRMGS